MTLIEMEGFLSGKCLPGDMLVNETNAQYLHRKLSGHEATVANLTAQVQGLAAESVGLKHAMSVTLEHVSVMDTGQAGVAAMIINDALHNSETPDTDAVLAEIRNEALIQYANKAGFSFQHGSIHAHFGNGNVMVGSVTFEDGSAGINFAPVREKLGGVGTNYEWTRGKNTDDVDSVFVISSSNAAGLQVIRSKLDEAIDQLRKEQGK